MTTSNLIIQPLTAAHAAQAFDLASDVFARDSTLHRALGIDLATYRSYLRPAFDEMVAEGLSTVAFHTNSDQVLGCLIGTDFANQIPTTKPSGPLAALQALTQALTRQYPKPVEPGYAMLIDMAAVSPTARGMGLYGRMRQATQDIARARGFKKVLGELSSATTQTFVLQRLGHRKMAEIDFATFFFEGRTPFGTITDPPGLILAEGDL